MTEVSYIACVQYICSLHLPNAVYGCDAKPGVCWTDPKYCDLPTNPGNVSLGGGLQSCARPDGASWCCRDDPVEICGKVPGDTHICWASELDFENPMRAVELNVARNPESARSILLSLGLTISSPTGVSLPSTSSESSTSSISSTNGTNTTVTAHPSQSPNLSAGAIAGIVIGAVFARGLLIFAVLWFLRRRKWRSTEPEPPNEHVQYEPVTEKNTQSGYDGDAHTSALHELDPSTPPVQLSGSRADQRHELPS